MPRPLRLLAAPWALFFLAQGCAHPAPSPPAMDPAPRSPIVQTGAPILRTSASRVTPEQLQTPEFQALVARMVAAMREAPGVGLAAPQLGVPLRVFVVEDREELWATLTPAERAERERVSVPLRVFVNPELSWMGEEQVTFFEGCLSVAGFAALVPRAREVEVRAQDERGVPFTLRVRGWPARILQHEMDHLEGTLYLDRMHTRSFGTLPQVKARFAGRPIAEVLQSFDLSLKDTPLKTPRSASLRESVTATTGVQRVPSRTAEKPRAQTPPESAELPRW